MNFKIKHKLFAIILMSFFSNKIVSQINKNKPSKGKWYIGAEIGLNTIQSYNLNEFNKSIQGGILLEYYFAKQLSLSGRIKYFKTGVSFHKDGISSGFASFFSSPSYSGKFNGETFTIPLDVKWNFVTYKNLYGNIKIGYAYSIETKSEYLNYTDNLATNYPKDYSSINFGFGLDYYLNKKTALYINYEYYIGAEKGKTPSLLSNGNQHLQNEIFNIGIKFHLKKNKK